jgi:hypothetical protein
MAKKGQNGEVNKSAAIRELYNQNPEMKVKEIISDLSGRGISVTPNLVYLIKGKLKGERTRRRHVNRNAAKVAKASGNVDAVAAILRVKALGTELGGLGNLKALVDALCA